MISGAQIENVLGWLDKRYNASRKAEVNETNLYAKLAILELAGWVEESVDDIVWNLVNEKLPGTKARDRFEKIVKSTQGVKYNSFANLLRETIGFLNFEIIQRQMQKENKLSGFKSALNKLAKSRDDLAHTFSHGTQEQEYIDAPSRVREEYYRSILEGLKAFEEAINRNRDNFFR